MDSSAAPSLAPSEVPSADPSAATSADPSASPSSAPTNSTVFNKYQSVDYQMTSSVLKVLTGYWAPHPNMFLDTY